MDFDSLSNPSLGSLEFFFHRLVFSFPVELACCLDSCKVSCWMFCLRFFYIFCSFIYLTCFLIVYSQVSPESFVLGPLRETAQEFLWSSLRLHAFFLVITIVPFRRLISFDLPYFCVGFAYH